VYFYDVLFKIVRREWGSDTQIFIIKKEEEKILKSIKNKIQSFIKENEENKETMRNPFSVFNPLTSHLYFKISFLYLKTFIGNILLNR
jgi:hypothetical protein